MHLVLSFFLCVCVSVRFSGLIDSILCVFVGLCVCVSEWGEVTN